MKRKALFPCHLGVEATGVCFEIEVVYLGYLPVVFALYTECSGRKLTSMATGVTDLQCNAAMDVCYLGFYS